MARHDFRQRRHHRAIIEAVGAGQQHFDADQFGESRLARQPCQRGIGGDENQRACGQQHRLAADAIRERATDRQPQKIGESDEQRNEQGVARRQIQRLAEIRRVDGDEIERDGGQHDQHHALQNHDPIESHAAVNLGGRRMMLLGEKFRRLLKRAAQHEDERDDHAADEERNAPAPGHDLIGGQKPVEAIADQRAGEYRHLLAGRLERSREALVAWRRYFGEIDGDAAKLDAGRKSLQQPADHHDDRRVTRRQGDDDRAARHDRQRHDEALAPANAVDIGAQKNRAERAHQGAEPEHDEGERSVGEYIARREKGLADRRRIKAEQEEIEHFEEIARGRAQHRAEFRLNGRTLPH